MEDGGEMVKLIFHFALPIECSGKQVNPYAFQLILPSACETPLLLFCLYWMIWQMTLNEQVKEKKEWKMMVWRWQIVNVIISQSLWMVHRWKKIVIMSHYVNCCVRNRREIHFIVWWNTDECNRGSWHSMHSIVLFLFSFSSLSVTFPSFPSIFLSLSLRAHSLSSLSPLILYRSHWSKITRDWMDEGKRGGYLPLIVYVFLSCWVHSWRVNWLIFSVVDGMESESKWESVLGARYCRGSPLLYMLSERNKVQIE